MLELGTMDTEDEKEERSGLLLLPQTKKTRQRPTRSLETLSWDLSYSVGSSGPCRSRKHNKEGAKSSRRDILKGLGELSSHVLIG